MNKDYLRQILISQREDLINSKNVLPIKRDLKLDGHIAEQEITLITGVRRCGKSFLLEDLFLNSEKFKDAIYCNFEDPRLVEFNAEDFLLIYEIWSESTDSKENRIAIFDEIQNIEGWESWMNFFSKQKKFKLFITGSNSKLLSSELGTFLTGRYTQLTLYPLSVNEIVKNQFVDLYKKLPKNLNDEDQIQSQIILRKYLKVGGFPRAWLLESSRIVAEYYQNILRQDIVKRKKIRNVLALEKCGFCLMNDIGRKINLTKLASDIGIKEIATVEKYITYFEECYIGIRINKFESSIRRQLKQQSKFYAIDPALPIRIGLPTNSKDGIHFENIVLIELLRRGCKVFYWERKDSCEIDFVVETKDKLIELIQVCWSIDDENTFEREVKAFSLFEETFKSIQVSTKKIITFEKYKKKVLDKIEIITCIEWMYSSET